MCRGLASTLALLFTPVNSERASAEHEGVERLTPPSTHTTPSLPPPKIERRNMLRDPERNPKLRVALDTALSDMDVGALKPGSR